MARYIDADLLKENLKGIAVTDDLFGMGISRGLEIAETITDMTPTADVAETKHGHWIPSRNGINPIRCSVCNMPAPMAAGNNEFGDFEIRRYPSSYCHECGAKMDGKGGAECADEAVKEYKK